jgi:hypothetical protein
MTRWLGESAVDGDVAFRVGRDGDELVAEWIDLCELRSDRRGEKVTFRAAPEADARVVAKVGGGLAAALVRQLKGGTSLHASAVARDGRAIAFLGASGSGKSTLAAHLCRRERCELLADDIVRLDLAPVVAAHPTEGEHWLDADARARLGEGESNEVDKLPVGGSPIASTSHPIRALVALVLDGETKTTALRRLHGADAISRIIPCVVRFVLDEPDELVAEIMRLETLHTGVPVWELRAPRTWESLDETAVRALSLLGEERSGRCR